MGQGIMRKFHHHQHNRHNLCDTSIYKSYSSQPHEFWGVLEKYHFVFVPYVCLSSAGTEETC